MPPSRHSSSSHSSSSRASSSRSSPSSRSSSRPSRGPSSHSSSSHASGCSSSRSSLFGGISRGPSAHSSTSASSAWTPPQKQQEWRPRVNQPTGFVAATHRRPTCYYGKKHSYAYFPEDWVDAETGVSYEKGYYDETGRRYDNVAFAENGSYRNVVCHCPYCGQDTILDLSVGEEGQRYLSCAHCGGPMELRSELDTIQRPPNGNTHVYRSEESLKNAFPKRKKKRVWPIVAVVLLALGLLGKLAESGKLRPFVGEIQQISVVETKAETIYLEKQPSGAYHLVTDPIRADKLLSYDRDADSYYDETTACWLWRNTDVTPPVWQYWVEGISSDYGDWGWMEHEADGWYIEASEGEWIAVPARYDTSGLWWIE